LALALAAHGPSGLPLATHAQGRNSLNAPLMGFDPPSRYNPKPLLPNSRTRAPLMGFLPLQRMRRPELTARSVARIKALRGVTSAAFRRLFPHTGYGVALRFSQPLSDFSLRPPSCHFQTGDAPGVLPFKGLSLSRSPGGSSPPAYPLGVLPAGCAVFLLGGRHPQARGPFLKIRNRVFSVYRVFILAKTGRIKEPRLMSR
jgi:hypothetical protein